MLTFNTQPSQSNTLNHKPPSNNHPAHSAMVLTGMTYFERSKKHPESLNQSIITALDAANLLQDAGCVQTNNTNLGEEVQTSAESNDKEGFFTRVLSHPVFNLVALSFLVLGLFVYGGHTASQGSSRSLMNNLSQ